jgi:hypothetical protein
MKFISFKVMPVYIPISVSSIQQMVMTMRACHWLCLAHAEILCIAVNFILNKAFHREIDTDEHLIFFHTG